MSYQGFPDWDKLTCDGVQKGIQDLQMTLMTISDPFVRVAYEAQIEIGKGYFVKVCNIPQLPYGLPDRVESRICPNGQVLKEIGGGIDKYGNEIKSEYRCVAPTSVLDCPPNTRFYKPTRGIYTPAKCIPISNDGYDEGYGQTSNKCAGDFSVECNDGSCDITNGVVAACTGKGGVKGITSVNPVEKVVDVIKPKTEEEEYRNFIFLTMAAVGVYLILSE